MTDSIQDQMNARKVAITNYLEKTPEEKKEYAKLRAKEEYHLDIISLALSFAVAQIQSGRPSAHLSEVYSLAKEFIDYGKEHFPSDLVGE